MSEQEEASRAQGTGERDEEQWPFFRYPREYPNSPRAARAKRTIAHLPKRTRTALSKQAAKVAKRRKLAVSFPLQRSH